MYLVATPLFWGGLQFKSTWIRYEPVPPLEIGGGFKCNLVKTFASISISLRISYPAGAYSSSRQQLSNAAPFVSAQATHLNITAGMYSVLNLPSIAIYISDHNTNSIESISISLRIVYPAGAYSSSD